MEKLQLRHICQYLPFGLEILTSWDDIKGVKCSNSIYDVTKNGIDKHLLYALESGACKILGLRPLSDLTKEIEHNGERFVPLYELFKMSLGDVDLGKVSNKYEAFFKNDAYNLKCMDFLFGFDPLDNSFVLVLKGDVCSCNNQLAMFNKLYQWHFAVNIQEHLYINKNTLDI